MINAAYQGQYIKPAFGLRLTHLHIEDRSFEVLCESNRCGVVKAGMCDLAEFYKAKRLKDGMIFSQFHAGLKGELRQEQNPRAPFGMLNQHTRMAFAARLWGHGQFADIKPV